MPQDEQPPPSEWPSERIAWTTDHLIKLHTSASERILKYLILVNAGGAVTTISFLGATSKFHWGYIIALFMFVIGIFSSGFLCAIEWHASHWSLTTWSQLVPIIRKNAIKPEEVVERMTHPNAPRRIGAMIFFGWLSFVLFICGSISASFILLLKE